MNPTNKKLNAQFLGQISAPTPFLAIDLSNICEKYSEITKALPGVQVHYAVKANPEHEILKTLKECGSSFEIASVGELERVLALGVPAGELLYSNPVKPRQHITAAYEAGVRYFSYDNASEIEKLAKFAPNSKVYLRVSVSNHGSLIDLAEKFGAEPENAVSLLKAAKDKGLEPVGVTFHVGSQAESLKVWDRAFDVVSRIMNDARRQKLKLQFVDIGGGFPVRYSESVPTVYEVAETIQDNLGKLPYNVKILCEPGRYLVAESGVIACTVIGVSERSSQPWVFLDAGRFQAFTELFESESLEYPVFLSAVHSTDFETYTITGPTCDSFDTILYDVKLPKGIREGDRLYFSSCGAYTHVYGGAFNDFPVPTTYFV